MQDAAVILQELGDKHNWSVCPCTQASIAAVLFIRLLATHAQVKLLNSSAVCKIRMGQWEDAETQLIEAFQKDAKNPDTLANLITTSLQLGKSASRYVGCALEEDQ